MTPPQTNNAHYTKDNNMEILLKQGSQEWVNFRKKKIGASDAANILGCGFKTPRVLWEEKLDKRQEHVNDAMRRGVELEPFARQSFQDLIGMEVTPKCFLSDTHPFMMASLDGITEDGKTMVEIKCGGEKLHEDAKKGNVPVKYYSQMQHQMQVMGLDQCHYYSFDGERGALVIVERNNDFIRDLIEKEKAFYKCLITYTAPEDGHLDMNIPEWDHLRQRWVIAMSKIKEAEDEKEAVKKEMLRMTNEQEARGYGFNLSKVHRKGDVDYSNIEALKGLDLDSYRKKGTHYWTASVAKEVKKTKPYQ